MRICPLGQEEPLALSIKIVDEEGDNFEEVKERRDPFEDITWTTNPAWNPL